MSIYSKSFRTASSETTREAFDRLQAMILATEDGNQAYDIYAAFVRENSAIKISVCSHTIAEQIHSKLLQSDRYRDLTHHPGSGRAFEQFPLIAQANMIVHFTDLMHREAAAEAVAAADDVPDPTPAASGVCSNPDGDTGVVVNGSNDLGNGSDTSAGARGNSGVEGNGEGRSGHDERRSPTTETTLRGSSLPAPPAMAPPPPTSHRHDFGRFTNAPLPPGQSPPIPLRERPGAPSESFALTSRISPQDARRGDQRGQIDSRSEGPPRTVAGPSRTVLVGQQVGNGTSTLSRPGWAASADHPAAAAERQRPGILHLNTQKAPEPRTRGPSWNEDTEDFTFRRGKALSAIQMAYRRVDHQYSGMSDGRHTITTATDAFAKFSANCGIHGLQPDDAASILDSALTGTAAEVFATFQKTMISQGISWSVSEAFAHLAKALDVSATVDSRAYQRFTHSYSWGAHVKEHAQHRDSPKDLAVSLLSTGMKIQREMPKIYQGESHLRDFMVRAVQGTSFYSRIKKEGVTDPGVLRDRITTALEEEIALNPRHGIQFNEAWLQQLPSGYGDRVTNNNGAAGTFAPTAHGFQSPRDEHGSQSRSGGSARANGHDRQVGSWTGNVQPIWTHPSSALTPAAEAFFAQEEDLFGTERELVVDPDEWECNLDVLLSTYPSTSNAGGSYTTRRAFSDSSAMARRGFRFGEKKHDTRDPPPDAAGSTENPKDKNGKVLRCFGCNSRFHLIFKCPHATKTQRAFFGEILNASASYYNNTMRSFLGDVIPDLSEHALSGICEQVLCGSDDDTVSVNFRLNAIRNRNSSHDPADVIVDTGAPLSVCGIDAFRQDCNYFGVKFETAMSKLRNSKKRFSFGQTVLQSLGIGQFWFQAPDGRNLATTRHVVDNPSLPALLGLDTILALGGIIAPSYGLIRFACWPGASTAVDVPLRIGCGQHLIMSPANFRLRPRLQ